MGKPAGGKQKRTPKIKDKKQSERFKKAAQELGADEDIDISALIKAMAETVSPKFETYRHRTYNAHAMVKPVGTLFPGDLIEKEWKLVGRSSSAPDWAKRDLSSKGYHLYEVDMSDIYGADEPSSGSEPN